MGAANGNCASSLYGYTYNRHASMYKQTLCDTYLFKEYAKSFWTFAWQQLCLHMLGQTMFKLLNWHYVLTRMTENMNINTLGYILFWFSLTWTERIYVFYCKNKIYFFCCRNRNSKSNLGKKVFNEWVKNKSMIDSLSYTKRLNLIFKNNWLFSDQFQSIGCIRIYV